MVKTVQIDTIKIGGDNPVVLIAGPCVIEDPARTLRIGEQTKQIARSLGIPYIFKASFDKANRSSAQSFRGPGLEEGLEILAQIKKVLGVPVVSDIHSIEQVGPAAAVLDILQIPAFLCRQTDLLAAAAQTGKTVNVKKGQFLAPWDMQNVVDKLKETGNEKILLTERGVIFGYNNLVTDLRALPIMRKMGCPVVFDATHSVQLPGGREGGTGGDGEWAPYLSRAAAAVGCDALFWETHRNPPEAKSDKDNALPLTAIGPLWKQCRRIDELV